MAKKKITRHKSGLKAHRQSIKHAILNRSIKKGIRLAVRAVIEAAKAKDVKKIAEMTSKAAEALDKAAQHGTIHWKAAARKKSRLAAQVNKLTAAAK
jgi:small subunit ribosomal protein S20